MNVAPSTRTRDTTPGVVLAATLLMLPILALSATRELWAPDEPRYAEVAREAYEHGSLLVMHLNGALYPDKPPLLYWLAGLFGSLFDWSEFWMRVPSILATFATALLTARIARRFWSDVEARWAAAFYLSCVMVTEIGGRLQIDPLLTVLCLGSIELVLRAGDARTGSRAVRAMLLAGLCAGFAALAKGPVAWLHVGLPLVLWRFLRIEPRVAFARSKAAWLGFASLAIAPVLGWALAAVSVEPALAKPLFWGQHVGRVAEGTQHAGPPWYHLAHLPYLLLPWTLVFALGLASAWRELRASRRGERAQVDASLVRAAAWFAVVFLIFSIMKPKRDLYLLPIYPAFALIAAREWSLALASGRLAKWVTRTTAGVLLLLGAALSVVLPLIIAIKRDHLAEAIPIGDALETGDVAPILMRAAWVGVPLIAASIAALRQFEKRELRHGAIALMSGMSAAAILFACLVVPKINAAKSTRGLAAIVAARPEKPRSIPCFGLQPEGYRFYGGIPTVKAELAPALATEGRQFLGLITRKHFERLDADQRAKYRILHEQPVGGEPVLVLGAAEGGS